MGLNPAITMKLQQYNSWAQAARGPYIRLKTASNMLDIYQKIPPLSSEWDTDPAGMSLRYDSTKVEV